MISIFHNIYNFVKFWTVKDGLSSVYCIPHIALNFNKKFKSTHLKRQLISMYFT